MKVRLMGVFSNFTYRVSSPICESRQRGTSRSPKGIMSSVQHFLTTVHLGRHVQGGRRCRRWRRGDGGDRSEAIAASEGQKGEGSKTSGQRGEGAQARRWRRGWSCESTTITYAERTWCECPPHRCTHTHTHTQHGHLLLGTLTRHALCTIFAPRPHHRFPCVHRWKHHGRFGANVQIGTTGDAARTCRSGGRADRVGARIGGAQVRWAHRSGVCVCVRMWVGMRAPVCRTVGAQDGRSQDGRCAGQLV